MIIYNHNDPFSSLWWMYGSVIPQVTLPHAPPPLWLAAQRSGAEGVIDMRCSQVAPLSVLAAFHGVVAVYFKENYNLFVTNTTHTILSSTVGFLLLLKATLCFRHYGAAKQVLWPRQRARWLDPLVSPRRQSMPLFQAATPGGRLLAVSRT